MRLNTTNSKGAKARGRFLLLALALLFFSGCSKNNSTISFIALGTNCKISISENSRKLQKYVDYVYKEDDKLSYRKDNSEIAAINQNAGIKAIKVSEDVYALIKEAVKFYYDTQGAFNPLILPIVKLWGFDTGVYRVPSDEEIKGALLLTNINDLILNDEDNSVFLKKSGMGLDLGGIAKGYVSDELYKQFQNDGVKEGVLNFGGNVFVFGDRDYRVAIQKPYEERGKYDIVETVRNTSVITSGAYERFFEQDGKRYHHIIDPVTGYPSKIIYNSVTIISPSGALADAWATSIFIRGEELTQKLKEVEPSATVIVQ